MRRDTGRNQRRINDDRGTADDGCNDPSDDADADQKGDRQNVHGWGNSMFSCNGRGCPGHTVRGENT